MSANLLVSARSGDAAGPGGAIGAWRPWSPMPSLAPTFSAEVAPHEPGAASLRVDGSGNRYCFGAWCQRVPVCPGAAYRLRVVLRCQGIESLFLHVTPHVVWRRGELPEEECAADAIRRYRRDGDGQAGAGVRRRTRPADTVARIVGEDTFVAPANCDACEVRLLLRYAPAGSVWFDEVLLTRTEPPQPRRIRVGTMRYRPPQPAGPEDHVRLYGEQIDRLGAARPDVIVLPEFSNTVSLPARRGLALWESGERIPGPFCAMLAEKARAYRCYVCAGILEQEDAFMFNTAVLYDRRGHLAGKQRKVHPYWPEEPMGTSPGDSFDVFPTDFGVVGMMICYDSWWPESARLLALKGAELILFPNAGYEEKILPARAIDNNVAIAAATLYSPAAIVDSRGELLAVSAVDNVLTAEIDLNDRPKCHPNAGGNLNPGPGGARWARNSRSTRVDEAILEELRREVNDGEE
jgi:predicted amidohydrolase